MAAVTLRLVAIDDAEVPDVGALDAGLCRRVGREWDDATQKWVVVPGGTNVNAADATIVTHYFRECARGHLAPADPSTAAALGLPWKSPKTPTAAAVKTPGGDK